MTNRTRRAMRFPAAALLITGLVLVAGCVDDGGNNALLGAGLGALAGQAIGNDTEGTLLGAGVGYIIGNEMDKADQEANKD